MVEPRSQEPSLRSHHNQQFAVSDTGEAFTPRGNTYKHPEQPSYQQPPPGYINRAPVARNESSLHAVPIMALNPYQTRWTIKARVTAKTAVKHWNNANGTGNFSHLISLMEKICSNDDYNIPRVQYNFQQISEIENMDNQLVVDLLGVVTSVGPSVMIMRKNGTEPRKRTLQPRDMSGRSVEVTLWGNFCDIEGQQLQLQCDSDSNPILALIGARISNFSGRSVSTISSTQLKINPDFPDAESLRRWYINEGKNTACVSLSREQFNSVQADRKTIAQIREENLGRDKTDWITVKAAISHVYTDSFCYPACPLIINEKPCNKKVIDSGDGMWLCEKCDKSFGNCEYRYAVKFHIQDHTGTIYVTAFQEAGEQIFGCTAQELRAARNIDQDDAPFTKIIEGARWHLNLFKLSVREESFNDEPRVQSPAGPPGHFTDEIISEDLPLSDSVNIPSIKTISIDYYNQCLWNYDN
ncbi:hypothetical protein C2845_PM11G04740 [Panicum miliaceum]|uniref:Replication protein A subunit n=1 Tax=Panicum miliaceum TaxID=4540 RepID=A0A3L6RR40_PANMI|nr:hypothetical protein C2845_PM11G04740 [Panicum miliaceum]